jgi:hypothetical protein
MRFLFFSYFTTEKSLSTVMYRERWSPDHRRMSPATDTCSGDRSYHHDTQRCRRSRQWSSSHRVGGGTSRTKPCAGAQYSQSPVAEGVFRALPVALQINAEVAGQNADKLMWYNIRSRVDIGLVVFRSFRNNGGNAIHQFEEGGC